MTAHKTEDNAMLNAALAYAKDEWPVLPLRGKKPLTKHGVKDATRDEARITQWWTMWPDANIGLATGPVSGRLVLDIDIKKGKRGDESLRALEEEFGPLPMTLKSQTASGGWHFVFRMPDVTVKSRNGVREGIDFLADGKYFVAPPSMIDGKAYQWIETCEAAPCPSWVAALGQDESVPMGSSSEDRIPALVRELFPDGKVEGNGEWKTRCPFHDDHDPSLFINLENGMFFCFPCNKGGSFIELYAKVKNVSEEEARRVIHPPPQYVEELNREHAVIMLGGKCVILNEERDPLHEWKTVSFSSPADFKQRYQNRVVRLGERYVPIGHAWLKHRDRREYQGLVFAPQQSVPGYYNLWQGFAVEPKPGNCDLMLDHIRMNICGGNAELARYVLAWMAQAVQNPAERPGTALVLRGKQGTGKGILCVQFGSLFGPHFTHVTQSRHLVGNFNAHLKDALVVFADEAYWAGDKSSEGALKALVTEEWLPIEYKGKDVVRVANHVRLIIATNHDWPVPAGFEERRFCIIDVSDTRMQDTTYFAALMEQWHSGGQEGFLEYLLHYDLKGINLRRIPQTKALMETKLLTMSSAELFWYELLVRGKVYESETCWTPRIKKKTLHDLYLLYAKDLGQTRKSSETVLGITLKKLCPHVRDTVISQAGTSERAWDVGSLGQCREAFDRVMNCSNHTWDAPLDDANKELEALREAALAKARHTIAPANNELLVEDLDWKQFAPAQETGEKEQVTGGSASMQQPHPQGVSAEVRQGQSRRTPRKDTKRRSKQRCNRRSSRGHRPGTRPDTSEGRDIQQASKKQKPKKKGTPCNLHNLKKKPS